MKLLIPFVFVAATIVGVAVQLMPTKQEREHVKTEEIWHERDAALKKIKEEYAAECARIEKESAAEKAVFQAKLDAYVMRAKDCVRQAVLERLRAPATAQFGPIEFRSPPWLPANTLTLNTLNLELWVGYGYVDSQNSFGALLRQHYTVTIFANKKTRRWEAIESVDFSDN